jgi:hypothetical protein
MAVDIDESTTEPKCGGCGRSSWGIRLIPDLLVDYPRLDFVGSHCTILAQFTILLFSQARFLNHISYLDASFI